MVKKVAKRSPHDEKGPHKEKNIAEIGSHIEKK